MKLVNYIPKNIEKNEALRKINEGFKVSNHPITKNPYNEVIKQLRRNIDSDMTINHITRLIEKLSNTVWDEGHASGYRKAYDEVEHNA